MHTVKGRKNRGRDERGDDIIRETLCFERLALAREEQVSVEGEATLPGSMRDAVTVLSVQAQAYLEDARAMAGGMTLRGHVSFQALYTQGDLTRIRAMETTCDFEHSLDAPELQPDMRVNARRRCAGDGGDGGERPHDPARACSIFKSRRLKRPGRRS